MASNPIIHTNIGIKADDGTIVSTGMAGYLIYGPYIKILPGNYVASLDLVGTGNLKGKGRVEVTCKMGEVILANRDLDFVDFMKAERIQIDFVINKQENEVEVRLYCYDKSYVKISAIEIEKKSNETLIK